MLKKSIFIASSVPCGTIKRNIDLFANHDVICSSEQLFRVVNKTFSDKSEYLNVKFIKNYFLINHFLLIYNILTSKKIIIFHECSWFSLDLYLILLKKNYEYIPLMTLSSRRRISFEKLPIGKKIKFYFFKKYFNFYKTYFNSKFTYTTSIKKKYRIPSRKYSNLIFFKDLKLNRNNFNFNRNVLLIASKDVFNDSIILNLYLKAINILLKNGFKVYVKDHPTVNLRINIRHEKIYSVAPDISLETLNLSKFSYFISFASISLYYASFFGKTISLLRLLPNSFDSEIKDRINHLRSYKFQLLLPDNFKEFIEIFNNSHKDNEK